jgi:hypothetical protein
MSVTTSIPTLSPVELRARLQEILELAQGMTAAENEMRSKAADLRQSDYPTDRFGGAIHGELSGLFELLIDNLPEDGLNAGDLIERVEDTIGVVDMAMKMERGDAS